MGTLMCTPGKNPYVLQYHSGKTLTLSLPNVPIWTGEEQFISLHQGILVIIALMDHRYIVGRGYVGIQLINSTSTPTPETTPEAPPQYVVQDPQNKTDKTPLRKSMTLTIQRRSSHNKFGIIIDTREDESFMRHRIISVFVNTSTMTEDEIVAVRPKRWLFRKKYTYCSKFKKDQIKDLFNGFGQKVEIKIIMHAPHSEAS